MMTYAGVMKLTVGTGLLLALLLAGLLYCVPAGAESTGSEDPPHEDIDITDLAD